MALIPLLRRPLPVVLAELDLAGLDPLYISDVAYTDLDADVIALPRLGRAITFERRVTTIFWSGGASRVSLGDVELINEDGKLDWLLDEPLRDRPMYLYLGDDENEFAALTRVASVIIDRVESIGESALRLVIADGAVRLQKKVQATTYASGDQTGRPMPIVFGRCLSVPSIPTGRTVTVPNYPYFSNHDAAGHTVHAVYDQGATLTPTTQWLTYNTSPHFGFRLLQSSAGRVTSDASGPLIYGPATNPEYLHNIVPHVLGRIAFTDFDQTALNGLHTELGTTYQFGFFADGSVNASAILDGIADSISGYWYVDRLNQLVMDRWRMPSGAPAATITEIELRGEVDIELDVAPGLSTTVCAARNWHVHGPSELAGTVRDTATGVALQKDYRYRTTFAVHQTYSSAQGAVGGIRDVALVSWQRQSSAGGNVARPDSDSGHGTLLLNLFGLAIEAGYRAGLWDGPRWIYRAEVELSALQAATLEPGKDCVDFTVIDRATGLPRFGLDERLARVRGVAGVLGDGRVRIEAWGDGPDKDK